MNWAQQGHFSPELREERRKAYSKIKEERESRRCKHCGILFKNCLEYESHERIMEHAGLRN